MTSEIEVPKLIRDAGENGVTAYSSDFEQGKWSDNTRTIHDQNARRFIRSAESRALALRLIPAADREIVDFMTVTRSRPG